MRNRYEELFLGACLASVLLLITVMPIVTDASLAHYLSQFSADNHIENVTRARAFVENVLLLSAITIVWAALIRLDYTRTLDSNRPLSPNKNYVRASSAVALLTIAAFILHRFGLPQPYLFRKEGLLEILSAVLFFVTSILFTRIALMSFRQRQSMPNLWVFAFSSLAAFACLFVGAEEISWGQHYLQFETPDWMVTRNYQAELTVHNLLRKDALDLVSVLIFWALFIASCLVFGMPRVSNNPALSTLAPDAFLVGMSLLMVFTATRLHLDPAEFLLSLAALYYAVLLYSRTTIRT
jgi:hypothetical protein